MARSNNATEPYLRHRLDVSPTIDRGSRNFEVCINGVLIYSECNGEAPIKCGMCGAKERARMRDVVSTSLGG